LKPGKFTNKPGENYVLQRRPGVPAIEYIGTPALSQDVYKMLEMLRASSTTIGFANARTVEPRRLGREGEGGALQHRSLPRADDAPQRGRVRPGVLELAHHAAADLGHGDDDLVRGRRQHRAHDHGLPRDVQGRRRQHPPRRRVDAARGTRRAAGAGIQVLHGRDVRAPRFPAGAQKVLGDGADAASLARREARWHSHDDRRAGERRAVARRDPRAIPVFEWYDDEAHLAVHETYMASPEFKKIDPTLQDAFVLHRQAHQFNLNAKMAKAAAQQQALNPPLPGGPGGGGGAAPSGDKKDQPSGPGDVRPQPPALPRGQAPVSAPAPPPSLTH
jgi:hypothetical protein